MQQRKWGVALWRHYPSGDGWVAFTGENEEIISGRSYQDPATAILEADRWYRESEEAKAAT